MFFKHVKFPFEADLRQTVVRSDIDRTKLQHLRYDESKFDDRISQFLLDHGVAISHFEVFYTPPRFILPIHVDGAELSNLCKMNWVYGGKGSRMMWWKPKADSDLQISTTRSKMFAGVTPVGTPYLFADQKNCIMIKSVAIGQPTLVNVGQLHSVLNSTNEERWCLSAVLADARTGLNLQIDAAVHLLGEACAD